MMLITVKKDAVRMATLSFLLAGENYTVGGDLLRKRTSRRSSLKNVMVTGSFQVLSV